MLRFADFVPTTEKSLASFSVAGERFQAELGISFPLKPAVQRTKICKNKTLFVAMKVILIFLALLGRFGVRGIGIPELLLLLVTKEG